jgi:hypothetical protein
LQRALKHRSVDEFRAEVAPRVVCLDIIEGLAKFLKNILKVPNASRFTAPGYDLLRQADEVKRRFEMTLGMSGPLRKGL